MDPLLIALGVAGLLVGATGTWSPCGFSMIETIGPTGHTGGLRTTLAAAVTFAPFAVLGGAITFALLGWLGEALLGAGGSLAYSVAAAVTLAAALAEARGLRIVPQVRRQLPVGWRSNAPMPLAAAGYGVLLGLGFTTFVLSYGVWALMGVSLALGNPTAGLVVGIAFGIGRAVPIVVLAPLADRRAGERACEAMATRPGLLRGARIGDALALLAVAAVLIGGAGAAEAARTEAQEGSDPSVSGPVLAYEAGGRAILEQGGESGDLDGGDPAVGGPYVALIRGERVEVLDRPSDTSIGSVAARGADALAVSRGWLAVRIRTGRRDALAVAPISGDGGLGKLRRLVRTSPDAQFSRPSLDGDIVVYTYGEPSRSSLIQANLSAGVSRARPRTLRSSRTLAFTGPSISGSQIAYIETGRGGQSVRIARGGGRGRVLLRRSPGPPTLWTTELAGARVFVTVVASDGHGSLISVKR